jgi:dipeptidyl aminopeptidase/acylaminoacyl peptidase
MWGGGADERTPIEQTHLLASALRKSGKEPEVLIEPEEAHGYGKLENHVELYERVLSFLDRHIGSGARK